MLRKCLSQRSTILSCNASVATSNPIATNVGIQLLKFGANAADAAVGIAATLNVVDPGNTGLGGDCFVLYYDSVSKTVKGINGSGRSPAKLSLEILKKHGISQENGFCNIPFDSPFSVTIPGAAAGWFDTLKTFGSGKLSVQEVLNPAIEIAENGYPTQELTALQQKENFKLLKQTEYSFGDDFLVKGKTPVYGQVMTNQKLANVFKKLACEGKEAFYEGEIARSIVDTVTSAGGCFELDDLKDHVSTYDEPISTTYHGIRIWEMPPNGQGLITLMALNILEGFNLEKEERMSPSCLHKMIQSTQLAFTDGSEFIADPFNSEVPIEKLLSKEYANNRRNLIDVNSVVSSQYKPTTIGAGNDTVYFSVVDSDGNACSFINSIYKHGGSGLVPKDCGFILHCRGSNFSLNKNHRNCVEPRKRPYHTIIPGMATYDSTNELYASFGVMGGFMQPQGHIQVLSSLIDFKMDTQAAICLPRYCIDHSTKNHVVYLENTVPDNTVDELKRMGHNIEIVSGIERVVFGGAQIIQNRSDIMGGRVLWSASESRQDGCALGY